MSGLDSDPIEIDIADTPPAAAMSPYARAFVSGIIALGIVILARSVGEILSQPISWLWMLLMLLTVATGVATLRVPGKEISFSISDTFSIIAALLVGPAAGAVTAATDGFVLSCRMLNSRRSVPRVLFNMAFPALATWISAKVFFALAGPNHLQGGPAGTFRLMVLLALFGVLDFSLTTWTVATAVALEIRARVADVWREHFVTLWITYFGGIFAAMLMMAVGRGSAVEVLMLISPLPVLLYVAFRHVQDRARDQIQHLGKMNKVYMAAIEALAQAVDTKDQVTHEHVRRVQTQSIRLARALGISDRSVLEAIKAAALLHDVGKIGIPEHILNKPGRLSPSEFEVMKQHAPMGAEILSLIDFPYPVVPIVRHHHENWDGTGYPDKISGEAIPIGARILQVVDCYDALTSDRPYRRQLASNEALQILADRKGTMYDPTIVDAFFALLGTEVGHTGAGEPGVRPENPEATPRTLDAAPSVARGGPSLRSFYELGREITTAPSPQQLGDAVWRHIGPQLPAAAFVLHTYDADTNALVNTFSSDAGLATPQRRSMGEGLTGWVASTARCAVNSDARLDLPDEVTARLGLTTTLAVPAFAGDQVIAVLSFYSRDMGAFTDAHCRFAEAAAEIIAASCPRTASVAAAHAA